MDLSYDEEQLAAGQQIKATIPNLIADNQERILDRNRLLMTTVWCAVSSTAASWETVRVLKCVGPNLLGTASTKAIAGTIKAWASDASNFSIRVYHATHGTLSASITSSQTTKSWRGWLTGTFNAPSDGTVWDLQVDVQRDSGSGTIYVAGLALFC